MTSFSVEAAAVALLEARRSRHPVSPSTPGPGSLQEAFAVQDRVGRDLGAPGAWKVGGGGTCAPIAGPLVRPSPCRWPAGDFLKIGIEAEIAFLIGRDIPAGIAPPGRDVVRDAVASLHAAIEIVDSRFDVWPVPHPLWALADNQNNGGLVYETSGRPWREEEALGRAEVTVTVDGEPRFAGTGVNPGGDPFALLVWLADHLAARSGGLKAGTIVTTGSLTGIIFVEPGADVVASIAGLGEVRLQVPA